MIVSAQELSGVIISEAEIARFAEMFPNGCEITERSLLDLQTAEFDLGQLFHGVIAEEYLELIRSLEEYLNGPHMLGLADPDQLKGSHILRLSPKVGDAQTENMSHKIAVYDEEIRRLVLLYAGLH